MNSQYNQYIQNSEYKRRLMKVKELNRNIQLCKENGDYIGASGYEDSYF